MTEEEIAKLVPTYLKAIEKFYEERIRKIAERYGSRVHSWDVVNESATDFGIFDRKAVRNKIFDATQTLPESSLFAPGKTPENFPVGKNGNFGYHIWILFRKN